MNDAEAELEHLKRSAARSIWKRRDDKTPSGLTWREWFKERWKQSLEDYKREIEGRME